jgi:hypothetical protein
MFEDADGLRRDLGAAGGADTIFAGDGNDEVLPGSGSDYVQGGEGNDFIALAVGSDVGLGGPSSSSPPHS